MACTKLQVAKNSVSTPSVTSLVVTLADTTTGSTLVGTVTWGSGADHLTDIVYSVGSVSATQLDQTLNTTDSQSTCSFIFKNITGGTTPTITVTFTNDSFVACIVHEIGGADTTTQPEGNNAKFWNPGVTGTDANTANAAITPSVDGCYFYCSTINTQTGANIFTAGTDFSLDNADTVTSLRDEHYIQTTAASHIGSWTDSDTSRVITSLVVIKAAGGGGLTTEYVGSSCGQQHLGSVMIGRRYV